jgi:hypothetical protein
VNATPVYADYGATQEHRHGMAWQPSYLPEFEQEGEATEDAYDDAEFAYQEELLV